jgi:hypothetical protein
MLPFRPGIAENGSTLVSFGATTVDELRANIAGDQDDLRNRWMKRERAKEEGSIIINLCETFFDDFVKIYAFS